MRTVYLHIGRGKTGTTAIQHWLGSNRELLQTHNVSYLTDDGRGKSGGHQRFAKSFIENPPAYMIPAARPAEIQQQIFEALCETTSDRIILSSENFPLADVGKVAAFLRSLPFEHQVKIIFFARSQDELAESEYNQMVKLKRETSSFEDYARDKLDGCHFDDALAPWEREFGLENIICRIYDGSSTDVVSPFLSALSPELGALAAVETPERSSNHAVGMRALVKARKLNMIEMEDRALTYRRIFEQFANDDLPALFMDSQAANQFRRRFARSNLNFTRRYLGDACEDLGGRRFTDTQRDGIIGQLRAIGLV